MGVSMRLGINGFGRIGRMIFQAIYKQSIFNSHKNKKLNDIYLAGINDGSSIKAMAHLLKFDSTHGIWDKEIHHDKQNLFVDDVRIPVSITRDPAKNSVGSMES